MTRNSGYSDINDELAPRREAWTRLGRKSRLNRRLERNARWAAEARYQPPLYLEDAV